MIPEYNFYIGELYDKKLLLLNDNEYFDPSTESFVPAPGYTSTLRLIELKSDYLWVDKVFKKITARILYFDENEKYLGYYPLSSASNQILTVASGSKYISLVFDSTEENLIAYAPDKDRKDRYADFIYAVYSCGPVYKTLSKKLSKESGQEFFRDTLEGNISLIGEDFLKIYGAPLDTKFTFLVYYKNALFFKDYFAKTSCTFDYAKYVCRVKLLKEDQYSAILNRYDTEYNLYDLAVPTSSVQISKRPAIQLYIVGSSKVTTTLDGLFWESEVTEAQLDEALLDTKYHFTKKAAISEFQCKSAEGTNTFPVSALDFSGSFNNGTIRGRNVQYICELVKVASKGDPFEGVYSYYENGAAEELYTRQVRASNFYEYFAADSYVIRIIDTKSDNFWESAKLFVIDNPAFKTLGVGSDIPFKYNGPNGSIDSYVSVIGVNAIFARLICNVDSISVPNGDTYTTLDIPFDDFVQDNRNYKKCYGIDFGEILSTFAYSEKPTRYGRDDNGLYFSRPSSPFYLNVIPLDQSQWINSAIWYLFSEYYPALDAAASKLYTLKDAYRIDHVIQALLNKIAPGIKHENTAEYSQFLYDENNAVREVPLTLFITQKTNILKGEYDQAAKKVEISLESVMDMLKKCFKCYFWIEGNKLRVEHISWFQNGGSYTGDVHTVGLNLTEKEDKFNRKPAEYFQSEIEYDSQKLPAKYSFQYMDDQTEVFSNVSFEVDASYVEASEEEDITVSNFSVDIDYMLISPNSFSEDGFVVIGAKKSEYFENLHICPILSYDLATEEGGTYTVRVQNGYMAWPHLLKYYMYDLPALSLSGYFVKNLVPVSTTRFMQHRIKIPLPDNFNAQEQILTSIGNGVVHQMELNLNNRIADIVLEYEAK